jgi:hypothetical protein
MKSYNISVYSSKDGFDNIKNFDDTSSNNNNMFIFIIVVIIFRYKIINILDLFIYLFISKDNLYYSYYGTTFSFS